MDTSVASDNSKAHKILLSLVLLVLLAIAGLLSYTFLQSKKPSIATKEVVLENIDPKTAEAISGILVYSSSQTGLRDYYSPLLKVTFKYNKDKYNVFENPSSASISDINYSLSGLNANIYASYTSNDKDVFVKQYGDYGSVKVINEKEDEGLKVIVLTYTNASPIPGGNGRIVYVTILSKYYSDKLLVMTAQNVNASDPADPYYKDIKDTMLSINTDTSKIAGDIAVPMRKGAVQISFSKDVWSTIYQSDEYISLGTLVKTAKEMSTRFAIGIYDLYQGTDYSEAGIRSRLENDRKGFVAMEGWDTAVLDTSLKREIGGITFYGDKIKMKNTKNFADLPYKIREHYLGADGNSGLSFDVVIEYYEGSESHIEDAYKVLNSLKVTGDKISYAPTSDVLGESTVKIEKAAIIGSASVEKMYVESCGKVTIGEVGIQNVRFDNISNKAYEICAAYTGSGFYVTSDGYLITNRHVAAPNPEDVFFDGSFRPPNLYAKWVQDVIADVALASAKFGDEQSLKFLLNSPPQDLYKLAVTVLLGLREKGNATFVTSKNDVYVYGREISAAPSAFGKLVDAGASRTENMTKVQIVDAPTFISRYDMITKPNSQGVDLALLKVSGSYSKPALGVNKPDLSVVGSPVYVVGFPGIIEQSGVYSAKSETVPTVTSGKISTVKPDSSGSYDLVQVDASVSPGNSGGPIVSADGKVVAVVSLGIGMGQVSADYNVGVSSTEVDKLLVKNGVQTSDGEVSAKLNSALDNMAKMYYKRASKNFNDILALNPKLSYLVNPLLKISEDKIGIGEDKTPIVSIGSFDIPNNILYVLVVLSGVLILLLIVLAMVVLVRRRGRKINQMKPDQTPPPPPLTNAPSDTAAAVTNAQVTSIQ